MAWRRDRNTDGRIDIGLAYTANANTYWRSAADAFYTQHGLCLSGVAMNKILAGTVVLDLTLFFSGPQATLLLAGMGAEVIKIDDPATGDPTAFSPPFAGPDGIGFERRTDADMGIAYLKRARGKKSVLLDLKKPEGHATFLRLVSAADVVIDNFSAGVAERLGIDYASLVKVNPRIISCSLTGYGGKGPDANLKAYDLMVQAAVGLMGVTGHADSPPVKAGSPLSDAVAGVFAANGVVAALLHREKTGEGQAVDVAMADCLFSLVFDEPFDCYDQLGLPQRQGSRIMRFSPFNAYECLDGWVTLGAATTADWLALLRTMGRLELADDPRMMNVAWRLANNAVIDDVVSSWTARMEVAQIVSMLNAANVPCSPVRSVDDVLAWPHLRERNMVQTLWNPLAAAPTQAVGPGFPLKFSGTSADYDAPAPLPGQHSREVLARLGGLSDDELASLVQARIVA